MRGSLIIELPHIYSTPPPPRSRRADVTTAIICGSMDAKNLLPPSVEAGTSETGWKMHYWSRNSAHNTPTVISEVAIWPSKIGDDLNAIWPNSKDGDLTSKKHQVQDRVESFQYAAADNIIRRFIADTPEQNGKQRTAPAGCRGIDIS